MQIQWGLALVRQVQVEERPLARTQELDIQRKIQINAIVMRLLVPVIAASHPPSSEIEGQKCSTPGYQPLQEGVPALQHHSFHSHLERSPNHARLTVVVPSSKAPAVKIW